MENSFSARPLVGRWIALDLRPARPLTFLGPAWAALCGAVASGVLTFRGQSILFLILALLLCDVLLGAWRALWMEPEWRAALRHSSASAPIWLGIASETPASFFVKIWERVARRLNYLRTVVWPIVDSHMIGMFSAGVLALSIAAVLGQVPLVLTAIAMALALVEGAAGAGRGPGFRALSEIAVPWLIAQSAFGYFSWLSLVFIILFTLVYRALLGFTTGRANWVKWNNLTQLVVVLLLILKNAPLGAGIVALGLLAQLLWQTRYAVDRDGREYARRVQSYVLVAMLVAGLSLWL